MIKKKHTNDLSTQMAECEANYARIMQLLPQIDHLDRREFGVALPDGTSVLFCMEITERCKYTTMLDIYPLSTPTDTQAWSPAPYFSLRVYHDAKMAEVTAFDRQQARRFSYDYPNAKMFQRDEKTQLNKFLGEWLRHFLRYGHVLDQPGESVLANSVN